MALSDIRTTTRIDRHELPFHKRARSVCLDCKMRKQSIAVAYLARRVLAVCTVCTSMRGECMYMQAMHQLVDAKAPPSQT
jgi:hypothetical protein